MEDCSVSIFDGIYSFKRSPSILMVELLLVTLRTTADMNKGDKNRTRVPDRRLHGVALLQQHLDERRGDVAAPTHHARRPHLVTRPPLTATTNSQDM
jgi:hypothetical protein